MAKKVTERSEKEFQVAFSPGEVSGVFPDGTPLLTAAESLGFQFRLACNRRGSCGRCRMTVEGKVSPPGEIERRALGPELLKSGVRLGCQTEIQGQVTVDIDEDYLAGRYKILETGITAPGQVRPAVEKYYLELEAQTRNHNPADLNLLLDDLPAEIDRPVDLRLLQRLPAVLRSADYKVTVVTGGNRLISVEPGDTRHKMFGLAVDIGTTTVVVGLYDLRSGMRLGLDSTVNPQTRFGADAVSRLTKALEGEKERRELSRDIRNAINLLAKNLLERAEVDREHVYDAVLAGNTIMGHLLLDLDPAALSAAPYTPVFQSGLEIASGGTFLPLADTAHPYLLPSIGGFVGSDTVAVIMATELEKCPGAALAVDIGTNGEIVLAVDGVLTAASTAAGPAFEGAQIEFGMGGESGAVEGVSIDENGLHLKVIGDTVPRGICGSGLIDLAAVLLGAGVIDPTGRIVEKPAERSGSAGELTKRITRHKGEPAFLLYRDEEREIVLTQKDVRELQLAKGAIRAGIEVMLAEAGIAAGDLTRIDLAGAFGNFIDPAAALAIGLLPPVPLDIIRSVGNAAFDGARLALFDSEVRGRAERVAADCRHLALSGRDDFRTAFADFMLFGDDALDR